MLQCFVSSLRRSADSRNDKSRTRHKSLGPDLGRSVFRIRGFSIPTPPPFYGSARSRVLKSAVDFIEFDGRDYGFASNIEQLKDTFTMSRAQPKSSPTDEHARRIAQAIAKGRPPVQRRPRSVLRKFPTRDFAAFAGAARHMPPAGKDEPLAIGYLFLLQRLLEHLRYRTDRGYADAAKTDRGFSGRRRRAGRGRKRRRAHARLRGRGPAPVENPCIARACCGVGKAASRSRTRTDRFRPMSTPLSPASSKPATAIRLARRLADRKRSCHAGGSPRRHGRCLGALRVTPKRVAPRFCSCSIQVRLCAARLPGRLRRSPLR